MDLILIAQGVAEVVTSTVTTARPPAEIFGLTVVEWGMLLGALATFAEALRQRAGKVRSGRKLEAVAEALADTVREHPSSRSVARRIFKKKATQMGVNLAGIEKLLESKDDSEPKKEDQK